MGFATWQYSNNRDCILLSEKKEAKEKSKVFIAKKIAITAICVPKTTIKGPITALFSRPMPLYHHHHTCRLISTRCQRLRQKNMLRGSPFDTLLRFSRNARNFYFIHIRATALPLLVLALVQNHFPLALLCVIKA